MDAIPAAGMVEENPFFDWPGIHLAIFAEMDSTLREAVGLPAGIQAIHVGFVFVRPDMRVEEWCVREATKRTHKKNERKHGCIADSAYFPAFSPPAEGPVKRPTKHGEENCDDNGEVENVFADVVKNVMAHLMAHDGLNLFTRSTAQEIIVERDAHGPAETADVCAHARRLARGVHLIDLLSGNPIGARHAQDGLRDLWIFEHRKLIEERKDEDRSNHNEE